MHTCDPERYLTYADAEALAAGVEPKEVWAAVWRVLELPPSER